MHRCRHPLHRAACEIDAIDLRSAVSLTFEHDRLAVRSEPRRTFVSRMIGNPTRVMSIRIHHVDIAGAGALRGKSNGLAVGRPHWVLVRRGIFGETDELRAIGVHTVDIPRAVAIGLEHERTGIGTCLCRLFLDGPQRTGLAVAAARGGHGQKPDEPDQSLSSDESTLS